MLLSFLAGRAPLAVPARGSGSALTGRIARAGRAQPALTAAACGPGCRCSARAFNSRRCRAPPCKRETTGRKKVVEASPLFPNTHTHHPTTKNANHAAAQPDPQPPSNVVVRGRCVRIAEAGHRGPPRFLRLRCERALLRVQLLVPLVPFCLHQLNQKVALRAGMNKEKW